MPCHSLTYYMCFDLTAVSKAKPKHIKQCNQSVVSVPQMFLQPSAYVFVMSSLALCLLAQANRLESTSLKILPEHNEKICKIPPAVYFQQVRLLPRLALSCNCILTQHLSPLQYGFSPRDVVGERHINCTNTSPRKDYLLQ